MKIFLLCSGRSADEKPSKEFLKKGENSEKLPSSCQYLSKYKEEIIKEPDKALQTNKTILLQQT
ncbi:hypothetical protein DWQ65_01770 [Treponema phagedenis]|uniref:Uncharacterized protein n=1 Tax=Treponema phagedenis TaxID=162 RepID=A0A0B7GW13_TREPH|nr:hypothetical protein C5O78_11490 [Treponema phagedenis]QSH98822.1 hypothetical protein DWQ65_01770 [Treponema phagedenis]CEM62864.1 conserved hypothetical protein [Treponema phagedenis]